MILFYHTRIQLMQAYNLSFQFSPFYSESLQTGSVDEPLMELFAEAGTEHKACYYFTGFLTKHAGRLNSSKRLHIHHINLIVSCIQYIL